MRLDPSPEGFGPQGEGGEVITVGSYPGLSSFETGASHLPQDEEMEMLTANFFPAICCGYLENLRDSEGLAPDGLCQMSSLDFTP